MLKGLVFALLIAAPAWAQQSPAPVREQVPADYEAVRQRAQMRAGAAYRELGETQYRTRLAEQEVWAAEEALRVNATDAGSRLAKAEQALAAAKSREAGARAAYDKALLEVERIQRAAQPK